MSCPQLSKWSLFLLFSFFFLFFWGGQGGWGGGGSVLVSKWILLGLKILFQGVFNAFCVFPSAAFAVFGLFWSIFSQSLGLASLAMWVQWKVTALGCMLFILGLELHCPYWHARDGWTVLCTVEKTTTTITKTASTMHRDFLLSSGTSGMHTYTHSMVSRKTAVTDDDGRTQAPIHHQTLSYDSGTKHAVAMGADRLWLHGVLCLMRIVHSRFLSNRHNTVSDMMMMMMTIYRVRTYFVSDIQHLQ